MDAPPALAADEKPSEVEFGRLALAILQEMAASDPTLNATLSALGIGPRSDPVGARAADPQARHSRVGLSPMSKPLSGSYSRRGVSVKGGPPSSVTLT